jgi:copper chaperone NosL
MTRHPPRFLALSILLGPLLACASGPPRPADLDTKHDACAHCRMVVSDQRFAAQLVAPSEEPRFFDDIGCLRAHLGEAAAVPMGAVAYVADHRTRTWVRAVVAVYSRDKDLETPMSSHIIAHADAASRDQDPAARNGEQLSPRDVFGAAGPPDGAPR